LSFETGTNQGGFAFFKKTELPADFYAACVTEIKAVLRHQAAIISEGRSLMAALDDCLQKKQIGVLINLLNMELQHSSERLEELITRFQSA
jgi:hypothetical protein